MRCALPPPEASACSALSVNIDRVGTAGGEGWGGEMGLLYKYIDQILFSGEAGWCHFIMVLVVVGGWRADRVLGIALWVRRPSQHQHNLVIFPNPPPLGKTFRHRLGAERTQLPDSATPEDQTTSPVEPLGRQEGRVRGVGFILFYFIFAISELCACPTSEKWFSLRNYAICFI